jgi:hypothetical protein
LLDDGLEGAGGSEKIFWPLLEDAGVVSRKVCGSGCGHIPGCLRSQMMRRYREGSWFGLVWFGLHTDVKGVVETRRRGAVVGVEIW